MAIVAGTKSRLNELAANELSIGGASLADLVERIEGFESRSVKRFFLDRLAQVVGETDNFKTPGSVDRAEPFSLFK